MVAAELGEPEEPVVAEVLTLLLLLVIMPEEFSPLTFEGVEMAPSNGIHGRRGMHGTQYQLR